LRLKSRFAGYAAFFPPFNDLGGDMTAGTPLLTLKWVSIVQIILHVNLIGIVTTPN
jgi:hypothetical protein